MAARKEDVDLPDVGSPDPVSAQSVLKECMDEWKTVATRFLVRGQYNERMVAGEQYIDISDEMEISDSDWPSWAPKATRNLMRNLHLTWASRSLEDRPFVAAYPARAGMPEAAARIADQYLKYLHALHSFDDMCFTAAEFVQPHTCVAFKTVWDPLAGPPEPPEEVVGPDGMPQLVGGGSPTGEVSWQALSIFDYGVENVENVEDASWCFFRKHVDKYEGRALLSAAGYDGSQLEELSDEKWTDTWGVSRQGVEVVELWFRPGFRFPKGLYAVFVGGKTAEVRHFPYDHGQLPIAVWKCGRRRECAYGTTHVDDAVYIQKTINKIVSGLDRQAEQVAAIKLLAHSSIIAAWTAGNGFLPTDDPAMSQYARYLEPPNRAEVLVTSLEDNVQALFAVYGLNEVLTGAENAKSGTSAKSIAYLNKLDSMKMSGSSRSLAKAIIRMCRQSLRLAQQYVVLPRLSLVGGEGDGAAEAFVGADFDGVDVRIEPASGLATLRGALAQEGQEALAAGNATPQNMHQARTGLQTSALEQADREVVAGQLQQAAAGAQVQADPEVDPAAAMDVLLEAMEKYAGTPQGPAVASLLRMYRQRAAQAQQQQQGVQT